MAASTLALAVLAPPAPGGARAGDDLRPAIRARPAEGKPAPAIRVALSQPDAQLGELLGLFRGARAEHPAAALAAWKRASAEPKRLGKPLEALIAAFNPSMIGELRTLDGARGTLRFDPDDARPDWWVGLPRDDGTFAALGAALALTDGESDGSLEGRPVDRLGRAGSPWMAHGPAGLIIAADRAGLDRARLEAARAPAADPSAPQGISAALDPRACWGLLESRSIDARRLGEILAGGTGPPGLAGSARLAGSGLSVSVVASWDRAVGPSRSIDPSWLDRTPAHRAAVAFALAIEPGPGPWASLFELLDRVERVDPARANVAPSRLRIGLLARAGGVRIEEDWIPHLVGASGWIAADATGRGVAAGLVALHFDDEASLSRSFSRLAIPDAVRKGLIDPALTLDGRTLLLSWGREAWADSEAARAAAGRSARRPVEPEVAFQVSGWPGRWAGLATEGSPLAAALLDSEPVIVRGRWRSASTLDVGANWPGLDGLVRRFLERIPLDPPPDR